MAAFNKTTLSHFTYHWFLGLQYHEREQSEHLSSYFDWKNDGAMLTDVVEKQRKIDGYSLFFKFFYWLFNIKGYASDFYKLAAWFVPALDEGDEKMIEIQRRVKRPFQALGRGLNAVWVGLTRPSVSSNAAPEVHEKYEPVIIVSAEMQTDLQLLGLPCSSGSELHWADVQCAYRKTALLMHPDKGGSDEDFQRLTSALDRLLQLCFPEAVDGTHVRIVPMCDPRIVALFAQVASLKEEIRESRARTRVILARTDAIMARTDAIMAESDAIMARTDACIEKVNQSFNDLERDIAFLQQGFIAMEYDVLMQEELRAREDILNTYSIFAVKAQDEANKLPKCLDLSP